MTVNLLAERIVFRQRGEEYFSEGKWDEASTWFTQAISADIEDTASLRKRAECFMKLAKGALALADINRALSLLPSSHELWNQKANYHFLLGQYQDAEVAHIRALHALNEIMKETDNENLWAISSEYTAALQHCRGVHASGSTERERGESAMSGDDKEQLEDALRHFRNAIHNNREPKQEAELTLLVARVHHKLGDVDTALATAQYSARIYPKLAEAHVFLSKLHQDRKEYTALHQDYENLLNLDPENSDYREKRTFLLMTSPAGTEVMKGDEAFAAGRYTEAVDCYTQALTLNWEGALAVDKTLILGNRAAAYAKQRMWDEVMEDANECISLKPKSPEGYLLRARSWMGQLKWNRASDDLDRADMLDPNSDMVQASRQLWADCKDVVECSVRAEAAAKVKVYSLAAELLMKAVAENEYLNALDQCDLLVQRSIALCMLSRGKDAMADAQAALDMRAESLPALHARAEAHHCCGNWDAAVEDYQKLVEQAPTSKDYQMGLHMVLETSPSVEAKMLADTKFKMREYQEALNLYTLAIVKNTQHSVDDALLYSCRSQAYLKCKRLDEAAEDAESVVAAKPDWFKGYICRADVAFANSNFSEAYRDYLVALDKCPKEAERSAVAEKVRQCLSEPPVRTFMAKGDDAFRKGDFDTAILMYTDALDANEEWLEDDAVLLSRRSSAFAKIGITEDALKDANAAVRFNPALPDGYIVRAEVYIRLGEMEKARKDFQKVVSDKLLLPTTSAAHQLLTLPAAVTTSGRQEACKMLVKATLSGTSSQPQALSIPLTEAEGGADYKDPADRLKATCTGGSNQSLAEISPLEAVRQAVYEDDLVGRMKALEAMLVGEETKSEGDSAFVRGDYEKAIRHYTVALDSLTTARDQGEIPGSMSDDKIITYEMATLYNNRSAAFAKFGRSRAERALADAERALEGRPGWHKALASRATALTYLGSTEAAAEDYKKAYSGDELAEALLLLDLRRIELEGDSYVANSQYALAVESFTESINGYLKASQAKGQSDLTAVPAKLYLGRSKALMEIGDLTAIEDGQMAIRLAPAWALPRIQLVKVLLSFQRAEEAYPYALFSLAECASGAVSATLTELRDLEEAREQALQAISNLDTAASRARLVNRYSMHCMLSREHIRIFCVSNLHVDRTDNLQWCQELSSTAFMKDILIVAGNMGDTFEALKTGLRILQAKFSRVFFVPGNHDLWITEAEAGLFPDSVCKLVALRKELDVMGVDTGPAEVATGVFIVPLLSWYNCAFDEKDPHPGRLRFNSFCNWPMAEESVWSWMLRMNEKSINQYRRPNSSNDIVITASHFLPRTDMPLPPDVPEIAKNIGCKELDVQIQQIRPDVHVFGHSHIETDGTHGAPYEKNPANGMLVPNKSPTVKNNTRYVQRALTGDKGDAERLYCIFDDTELTGKYVPFDGGKRTEHLHGESLQQQASGPVLRRADLAGFTI
uniref:Calcineurin-like phosphoesterase domain-containing protein n=1 Tax=Pyramimonas obovata TaxID=1411642 RepID=A0A7S0N9U0_9CHLO|mmetsp:Transcript_21586/g.47383  ORF Transcript_21586/g.47383 Transcript_21586/m.47383 type:complete len:1455 (+) Transcript_21586:223-4587(+)|eukprot:CAMPEP_0118952254 /NCGR_PEP_ID=MMETSP1169-20130426/54531_1 /TAXON_ID=36882 /ORGANISM="Pyramimonas obovata, Strain CCMP722" /LENGTH=1454 /DNA_ID=CAMNT_0006899459 /DNA_START=157 /DNA_END=4521 /DNA_ORIENTATION=-